MAQWRQIQSLAKTRPEVAIRLSQIYKNDRKCLLDIRQACSDWMENINWASYDLLASGMIGIAQQHFQELLQNIDKVAAQSGSDIVKRINLTQSKQKIQDHFSGQLLSFVEVIKTCLGEEQLLIQSCEPSTANPLRAEPTMDRAQENHEVAEKIRQLSIQLQVAEQELFECTTQQNLFKEKYNSESDKIKKLKTYIESMQHGTEQELQRQDLMKKSQELQTMITTSFQRRINVADRHVAVSHKTKQMVEDVWQEIEKWKKDKKMEITGISKPKEGIVDVLDKMCNHMNQILMQLLGQLDKLVRMMSELKYNQDNQPDQPMLNVTHALSLTEQLLKLHLERVFVVDRNPPRVLKVITGKSLGFAMSCRILGGHSLGLQMNPPHVTATLHKEQEITTGLTQHCKYGMCTVVNGQDKIMEFHREAKQWVALFNSVQLTLVKQLEKNNDRLVMENLNGMIFYTILQIRGKEYKLAAVSLPMVLISHVLQDCQARGFLVWDAAFSQDDTKRKMFDHPEQVSWHRVAQVLSALFQDNTGRGLKEEHLNYLGKVAFKERKQPEAADLRDRQITKNQLIKDKLQKDFQFWKWFYANMNLIKERLKQEWQDELIYGFIAKDTTIKKLSGKQAGTFMLRFSESDIENSNKADICGCLTLAVLEHDPESEMLKVFHVKEHLTPKDIFERGLAPTLEAFEVKDFEDGIKRPLLTCLYPDRDFSSTFNKYILQKREAMRSNDGNDYKAGQLRIEIFLGDAPSDRRALRGRGSHVMPMSPASSIASEPMSPQMFAMSPRNDSMDDSSQFGNGSQIGLRTEGGKKQCRAIGIVQPSAVSRQVSTSSNASTTPINDSIHNLRIGSPATQQPNMMTTSQQHVMSSQQQMMTSSQQLMTTSQPLLMSQQQATPVLQTFQPLPTVVPVANAQPPQPMYANAGEVAQEIEIDSGGSNLDAIFPDALDTAGLATDYFDQMDSGDIPVDSSGSGVGSGVRLARGMQVPASMQMLGGMMVLDGTQVSAGPQVPNGMQVLVGQQVPSSVAGLTADGDLELSQDLYDCHYGFNLASTQPGQS